MSVCVCVCLCVCLWADWRVLQRLRFVALNGSEYGRNRPDRGRMGTRLFGGQPAPRWDEGVALAREMQSIRTVNSAGTGRLSVGSRIREAHSFLRRFFGAPANSSNE